MPVAKKILVVEDEPPVLMMLRDRLALEGFDIVTATNGKKALLSAERENPDLILLDILLPKVNGFEVLEKIKKNPKTMKIPVIVLTALSQPKNIEMGIRLYADKYLVKPVVPNQLVEEIKKTLAVQES